MSEFSAEDINTRNTGPLDAQSPIEFAFAFSEQPEAIDDPAAIVNQLHAAVAELEQLPADSNLVWEQDYWDQKPGDSITGQTEQMFADGSTLHVNIRKTEQAPKHVATLLRGDTELCISFMALHPSEHGRSAQVTYRVERNGQAVLCEPNKAYGMQLLGMLALKDKLDEVDPLQETDLEVMIDTSLAEGSILAHGLSPDMDTEVAELRDSSEAYRVVSDSLRAANENSQLAKAMGIESERVVGQTEAAALITLLRSL